MSDFLWDAKAQRYRYADTKRFLSREAMLSLSRRQIDATQNDIGVIAQLLIDGKISLRTWQEQTAYTLKLLHLRQSILSRGGVDQMKSGDYLEVARTLKGEYGYLRQLAQDVRDGKITAAQFKARIGMYSAKSRVSFDKGEQALKKKVGYQFMRRYLGATDKHCSDCIYYFSLGLKKIGELPLPTESCQCRSRCKCSVRYFKEDDVDKGA
jgi:hypothetical protein